MRDPLQRVITARNKSSRFLRGTDVVKKNDSQKFPADNAELSALVQSL